MCGFVFTTDLGKLVFYFSCKIWSSKVYTCFVEVAVLVTQSTEKLVLQFLDFSTILYAFYKMLPKHTRGKDSFREKAPGKIWMLTDMPFVCAKGPGITWVLAMWPLGQGGGAAGRNPATSPTVLVGEAAGEGLGFTRARFGCLLAAESRPLATFGGAGRRVPLGLRFRRTGGSARPTSRGGGSIRS
jgi:hypothetical protein